MKFLTLALTAAIVFSQAALSNCAFELEPDSMKVDWTAYKTPSKVGVNGSFTEIGVDKKKLTANSIQALFDGLNFAISTKSVFTKNKQRDEKIFSFFFSDVKTIKGHVVEADEDAMIVEVSMNGIKRKIPLNSTYENGVYKAQGVTDILDFSMSENLKSINQACAELHQGKTWSDVKVSLTARIKKTCK